jgi:hypothetical protein
MEPPAEAFVIATEQARRFSGGKRSHTKNTVLIHHRIREANRDSFS